MSKLLITFWFLFLIFVQLKMWTIESELLKSNGGHRPQPTLLTCLDWPNGPHWYKSTCARMPQTTSLFFSPSNDRSVHRPHFWTCSITINSVVPLLHFTAYWATKSDNWFVNAICQYHMSKIGHVGLHISRFWYWTDGIANMPLIHWDVAVCCTMITLLCPSIHGAAH